MAALVLAAIYPLVMLVTVVIGLLAGGRPYLGLSVPFGVDYMMRTLLTAIVLVVLMTWAAMPLLTRLARRWLYPTQ